MRSVLALILALALAGSPQAAEEQQAPPSKSRKGRVIGTVAGAAGGFVLGVFAGLNWFDDAVDSDRRVWTTAFAFAAAGGTAGYFIGRAASPSTGAVPQHGNNRRPDSTVVGRDPGSAAVRGLSLPQPVFTSRRRGYDTSARLPSRSANARIAVAFSEPVDGIIHGWPTRHGEPLSRPSLPPPPQ